MDINATIIGQLLTFLVLIWFTMKYIWPPITTAMLEREKKIAGGLEAAERSKRELDEAQHKILGLLRDAKVEASAIIDQSHKRANHIIEEAKANARIESDRIVAHAKEEIAREVIQAKEGLRKQLARLAIAGAEKIIERNLDASAQTALLDEFAAEI